MQDVLVFLIVTILFWMAGFAILRLFFAMIQPEGALDLVFGWQNMLADLYGSEKKWKQLLGKALGDCQQCTSFWFMPIWYLCYYGFCKLVLNIWVTDTLNSWLGIVFVNWLWMTLFWSIGAVFGLFVLLFKFKK